MPERSYEMTNYQDCPVYLKDFLFYLQTIKGRSKKTVDAYHIDLRTFLRYIKCVKLDGGDPLDNEQFPLQNIVQIPIETIASITLSDVYQYLNYTADSRGNNAKTRSRKVSSIRSFFDFLTTKSTYLKENPVKNLEVPSTKKAMPKYLSLEESLELLTGLDTSSPFYQRDFCILTLFLNCGMRLSELVGINLSDIREDKIRLLGKGNKERIVYLNHACEKAIDAYLKVRTPSPLEKHKNAFFLSSRGTRLSARRVEQIVEACLHQCGLSGQGYSPHKLRHTAATLMYQHGHVDLLVLKEILGHVSLSTTEIYTHLSSRQKEEAAKNTPLASVSPKQKPKAPK